MMAMHMCLTIIQGASLSEHIENVIVSLAFVLSDQTSSAEFQFCADFAYNWRNILTWKTIRDFSSKYVSMNEPTIRACSRDTQHNTTREKIRFYGPNRQIFDNLRFCETVSRI